MIEIESQKPIKKQCLRLLSRREYSQQELVDKLVLKGFERPDIQVVIDQLAEQGWQSDQRFFESYSRYRINKGFGPIKINFELQQRGIHKFDINTVVVEIADNWIEILEQVYEKKFADNKQMTKDEWLKRCRFLQQRGFSLEMITTLFQQLSIQIVYS